MISNLDEDDQDDIPFFPIYDYQHRNGNSVWWFEREFSQIHYGSYAHRGTNSCTLITILVAEKIARSQIQTLARNNRIPYDLVFVFGRAILEGNSTYVNLSDTGRLQNTNLNIPEAMEAMESYINNLEEWYYVHIHVQSINLYKKIASEKLYQVLEDGLGMWQMVDFGKDYLFVVIIADSRSVLLCFQKTSKTITLFDSHQHSVRYGAVVAQTHWENLLNLCIWIAQMFLEVYQSRPTVYELSFIPAKG